jgi:hypothetical protein
LKNKEIIDISETISDNSDSEFSSSSDSESKSCSSITSAIISSPHVLKEHPTQSIFGQRDDFSGVHGLKTGNGGKGQRFFR